MAHRGLVRAGVGAVTALVLAAGVAPPAVSADGDVVCDGGAAHSTTIAHTRIDGDLVVAPATDCTLDHVYVAGDLVVRAGGGRWDFTAAQLRSSEIGGTTQVSGARSGLSTYRSTLGAVEADDEASLSFEYSTVRGVVRGSPGGLQALGTHLGGVEIRRSPGSDLVTLVQVSSSRVDGDVHVSGLGLAVSAARITGELRVVDADTSSPATNPARFALRLCQVVVVGPVRVARSHDLVAIGGHPNDAAPGSCDPTLSGPVRTGTLSIVDNHHSATVANTIVTGDLRCYGNSGPRGVDASGATVTGVRRGQCATP